MTEAVQFWAWMTNWYWPVSVRLMVVSVAVMLVTTVAWRESALPVLQRVRQNRPPPDAEWLVRDRPGICSQHSAVVKARPAPMMLSSPPCSRICTEPAPAPCGVGLGPQASPQSPIAQRSVSALALQVPARVGLSWATPGWTPRTSARAAATSSARGQVRRRTAER
ncbi:MAG: hypothetical protein WKG00_12360 [Polyangiaceae bacterium]